MLERISQVSILHHVAIVLGLLAIISSRGWFIHPVVYFLSFFYLFLVHERYILRLRKRLLFESNKQAAQRRLLSDSESVRWLNHAVAKVWPVCMENIASQKFLLPIIPWFLDKYKPWTARKVVVQNLYLGKKPPIFADIRVIGRSADDDHLVMESGISFLSDDMSAVLAVKLRKRLGFGIWTKMHVTGMHIEGKALVGVKFLEEWPFLGRIRVSFVEPPYFQMTVKPIFSHGLDVTELPGIAGWLDKILSLAFEKSLVEPNMLVVDLGKFVSAPSEPWFEVDEKPPIANAKVEILEGADMKPSDMNGLADPYVKGKLGPYKFQTKIQWKTLNPEWREEFTIPIISWDVPNILALEVRDKDRIFDDMLGDYKLDIGKMQHGQRHDIWLALKNIKMGRLHLAVTVIEIDDIKTEQSKVDQAPQSMEDIATCSQADEENFSCETSLGSQSGASDEHDPIPIEGLEKMKVWVHRPGTKNVPQRWESRKGKVRRGDMELNCEENIDSPVSQENETHSSNKNEKGKKRDWGPLGKMRRAAGSAKQAIGSAVHKKSKDEFMVDDDKLDVVLTPTTDLHPVDGKRVGVNLVVDGVNAEELLRSKQKQDSIQSSEKGTEFDPDMKNTEKKDKPKAGIFKQAENAIGSLRKSFQKGRRRKEGADNSPEASCSGDSTPLPSPSPSPSPRPLAAEVVGMRTGDGNKPPLSRTGGIIRETDTSTTYMSTGETPTPKMEHTTAELSAPDSIRDARASTAVEKLLMKESEQQGLLDSDLLSTENPESINEELKSNQTKV